MDDFNSKMIDSVVKLSDKFPGEQFVERVHTTVSRKEEVHNYKDKKN